MGNTTTERTTPHAQISYQQKRISIPSDANLVQVSRTLESNGIPIVSLEDACVTCQVPCELGSFPNKFDVDLESQMNGSTKPYFRQVIVSTGISNWAHEVTETEGSLAYFLRDAHMSLSKKDKDSKLPRGPDASRLPENQLSVAMSAIQLASEDIPPPALPQASKVSGEKKDTFPAILDTSQSERLIINNGSFKSASDNQDCLTAIVLPDFTYVNEINETREDAERLWRTTLDPGIGRAGRKLPDDGAESQRNQQFQTRPLPYDSVVLICSHKRRDNRCGIAAPILEKAITAVLESRGWEVHTEVEVDPSIQPLEARNGDEDTLEAGLLQQIRESEGHHDGNGGGKRALLVKVSHIGGHKFAGNIIVYSPKGTGVWYGRVFPEKVPAVVDETIIGGKIIPELLRAAVNVSKGQGKSFYDW